MKIIPCICINFKLIRLCRRYSDSGDSRFFFYSREHDSIHIHIEGKDGYAVYNLDSDVFALREIHGIKAQVRKKIEGVLSENREVIVKGGRSTLNGDKHETRKHYI